MMKWISFCAACLLTFSVCKGQQQTGSIPAHDPVLIREDSTYYLFCTGRGITVWSSKNMTDWKREHSVFATAPQWAVDSVKGFKNHIWAPDISYYNGRYYLYYSISAFGKNTSCIGVATNTTLNPLSTGFKWEDHGAVIQSKPGRDNWNAIDPNLIVDKDGTPYLVFGSFWEGLKMVRLTKDRLKADQPTSNLLTIASRQPDPKAKRNLPSVDDNPVAAGGNAIEAPYVFKNGSYYYLFASIDYCCKGPKSTYKMIIGRSKKLAGPYKDKDGKSLRYGGGSVLLAGDANWYGVGHCAVTQFDGRSYLVFHGYDAADKGASKLRIMHIEWESGWPVVAD